MGPGLSGFARYCWAANCTPAARPFTESGVRTHPIHRMIHSVIASAPACRWMSGPSLKCRGLLSFLLLSCSSARLDPALSQPARAPARVWSYEVSAGAGARELSVHAALPPGVPEELE